MTAICRVLLSTGLCLSSISLVLIPSAYAQQNTSAVSGTVTSSAGAAVAGASVSALDERSGFVRDTMTTVAGTYSFPAVEAGVYTVTFKNAGFKTTVAKGIAAGTARRSVLNVSLESGDASVTVQMLGAPNQLMEGQSSVLGSEFSPKALADTPLFVRGDLRNFEMFVTWLPGVTNGLLQTDIAGGLRRGKEVLIDGAPATSAANGGVVTPFPTSGQLSEFRLLTNSLPAEFGRTSGGVEVWVARRGFNSPRGEVFEILRNDALDAAGWGVNSFGRQKPKLRQNEFGFQLGGPVFVPEVYDGRNRSFFNVSLNDYKQNDVNVTTAITIPTLAMRAGDFSRLVNAAGQQIPIYNPATLTDKGNGLQRDVFPNNKIPASLFSTVSKNVQAYLPEPANNGLTNNYLGRVTSALTRYAWGAKGDQVLNSHSRLSLFAVVQKNDASSAGPLPGVLSNGNRQYEHSQMYRVNFETSMKADSANQLTFAYTRSRNFWDRQPDQILNWSQQLGLKGVDNGGSSSFPVVNFTNGFASLGRSTDLETRGGRYDRTLSLGDAATRIRGRHELKMGFDLRLGRSYQNPLNDNGVQGVFNFAASQTASPSALGTTGNSYASFLLGAVDSASRVFTSLAPDYRTAYGAVFLQDNFRFSRRLTITAGLRYDLPFSRWDNNKTYSSFDPNAINPGAGGRKGALAIAGTGAGRTGDIEFGTVDKTEFGPRLGAAFQLNDKTVLRGGWGLLYANGNGLTASGCPLCNLGSTSLIQRTSNGLQEAFFWDNGLTPQASFRQPPVVDPSLANGGPVVYINPNNGQAPRFQNYSFNIQRQLPMGVLLDVAFAGNHGTRLSGPLPLNQVDPKYLAQGALLRLQITDPKVKAAGFSVPYAGFTGTLAQALRPYPQYTDITDPYSATLHSDYKSLQIKADKRAGSLFVEANYTYSRATSNGASSMVLTNLLAPQNQYADAQDTRSIDDIPQVLNLVYSWDLPVGRGKRFMGNSKGIVAALAGGWTLAAQQLYRSGNLLLVTAPDTLGSGVLFSARTAPNVTGQPFRTSTDAGSLDPNNPASRFINPAAFSIAPAFTFGNAPNLIDDVRNPGILIENFSAIKRTFIGERLNIEYRVDVQNLLNRNLFGNINTNLSDAAGFGRATGVLIQPRIIQMGLKLAF